jgi:dTMP kinase
MSGIHIALEGPDGCGKSTIVEQVHKGLQVSLFPWAGFQTVRHPGSTPLGVHLRKLIKHSDQIDPAITIDPLTRQILYMADISAFVNQILMPALQKQEVVVSDRNSFISSIVYGAVDDIPLNEIERLTTVIPFPKLDKLYILRCPWEERKKRLSSKGLENDIYDSRGNAFQVAVEQAYEDLLTASPAQAALVGQFVRLQDVVYIDSSVEPRIAATQIVNDILEMLNLKK